MGLAMLKGWLAAGVPASSIQIIEPHPSLALQETAATYDLAVHKSIEQAQSANILVFAIKPQTLDTILPQVSGRIPAPTMVLSILAGAPMDKFSQAFMRQTAIVRAMPNTPASIGQGITAAFTLHEAVKQQATTLLACLGSLLWLEDEAHMDAVTALSGSGPAYLFALTEAMSKAGQALGLNRELSEALARQTVIGAAALMEQSAKTPQALREEVTSPAGTTAAALEVLQNAQNGLDPLLEKAMDAAKQRSIALSQ